MSIIPSTDLISVPCYGVHWTSDGVAFIEQGGPRGGTNVLGLARKSPFRVRLQGKVRPCNHLIPMQAPGLNPIHLEVIRRVEKDPLVRAMLPIPKPEGSAGMWFVADPDGALILYLLLLSRMSSPVMPIRMPIWTTNLNAIVEELKQTNVQPLVISDVEPQHIELLKKLGSIIPQLPRRLIVCGRPEVILPPQAARIKTDIPSFKLEDLIALPWEGFGASVTRGYMRGENTYD